MLLPVARGASSHRAADCALLAGEIAQLADNCVESATPEFADAVLYDLLRRFWCYERIGPTERTRLREALDGLDRVDETNLPLSPTLRRVLVDERDAVLVERIRATPGQSVVAVVGKGHLPGIRALWNEDTDTLAAFALEEPPSASLAPRAAAAASVVALPFAAWRYRAVRYGLGGIVLGAAAGGAWLTLALRNRLRFFEQSQREADAALPRSRL